MLFITSVHCQTVNQTLLDALKPIIEYLQTTMQHVQSWHCYTCIKVKHTQYTTLMPDKNLWPSHNALLPMEYFVQVVMQVTSDIKYLKYKIKTNSFFWKQCTVGKPQIFSALMHQNYIGYYWITTKFQPIRSKHFSNMHTGSDHIKLYTDWLKSLREIIYKLSTV